MSQATAELVERASLLRAQITSSVAFPNPADQEHHERARLLRCAISLASFTAVEDFLKSRSAELLGSLNRSLTAFSSFPALLQEALTIGAVRNASWNLDGDRKGRLSDPVRFAQRAGSQISSTGGPALNLYTNSFWPNSHNVSWSLVDGLGQALLVEGPSVYASLAFHLSGGPFAPKDYMAVCLVRRNEVAHLPWADVAHGDVVQQVEGITKFCCVIDLILSYGVKRIMAADEDARRKASFNHRKVKIRFLDVTAGACKEIKLGTARAIRRHPSLALALAAAMPRCVRDREALVVRTGTVIESWSIPYL